MPPVDEERDGHHHRHRERRSARGEEPRPETVLEHNAPHLRNAVHDIRVAAKEKLKRMDDEIAEQRRLRAQMKRDLAELDKMDRIPPTAEEEREMRPLLRDIKSGLQQLKEQREHIRVLHRNIARAQSEASKFAEQLRVEGSLEDRVKAEHHNALALNQQMEAEVEERMKEAIKKNPELQAIFLQYMHILNKNRKTELAIKQVNKGLGERDATAKRVSKLLSYGRFQAQKLDGRVAEARADADAAEIPVPDTARSGNASRRSVRSVRAVLENPERAKVVNALHVKCDAGSDVIGAAHADVAACLLYPDSKLAYEVLGLSVPPPDEPDLLARGPDASDPLEIRATPKPAWTRDRGAIKSFVDALMVGLDEESARQPARPPPPSQPPAPSTADLFRDIRSSIRHSMLVDPATGGSYLGGAAGGYPGNVAGGAGARTSGPYGARPSVASSGRTVSAVRR